jgi:hypothetical protein
MLRMICEKQADTACITQLDAAEEKKKD